MKVELNFMKRKARNGLIIFEKHQKESKDQRSKNAHFGIRRVRASLSSLPLQSNRLLL